MILARIFTKIYKKSGIILIDSKGQKYICGNPRKDKPITVKFLKENLKWKLLVDPELEFPEAYMRGEIIIENASLKDFLMFPGSEAKLLKGLELGCSGCISAVTNVTHSLARKVFDDFESQKTQTKNDQLINVRETFDQYNLISALHSFLATKDKKFKNVLPPLILLTEAKQKELVNKLNTLNFTFEKYLAA